MSKTDVGLLPDDFDPSVVDDGSSLPEDLLAALREAVWRRCKADPIFFIEKFWSVIDPQTFEWTEFELRDYQHEDAEWMLRLMGRDRARALILKARQVGYTTLACALAFHDAYFTDNHPWLIASKGEDDAEDALVTRTKMPYRRLPKWIKDRGPELLTDNKEEMNFDNGSRITAIPATGSSGRSRVVYGVLYDEAAFVDEAEEMYGALDQACYGPMLVFSTANGMGGWFHGRWIESQLPDSAWESKFRPWYVVPHRGPFWKDGDGFWTSDWYEGEKRKNRGQEWLLHQENPRTAEEAFAKTGRTVFNIQVLDEEMDFRMPSIVYDLQLDPSFSRPYDEPDPEVAHELWVWEEPHIERDEHGRVVQRPNYVMGVDSAEGLEHGDRSSIDVIDANTGRHVASYLGHWPIEHLGELAARIGYRYHTALILPERNNAGVLPIADLQRMGYPRIWRMGPLASIPKKDKTPRYGWNTNPATKPKMLNEAIRETSSGSVLLRDPRFRAEAQVFVHDGKGGMNASEGNHDDKVISTCIAIQGYLHVDAYPIVWHDDSVPPVTMADVFGSPKKGGRKRNAMERPMGQPRKSEQRSFVIR